MANRSRNLFALFLFLLLGGLAGCALTQVTSSWTSPAVPASPLRKVLVVAVVPDSATRHDLERQLAAKLSEVGVEGVPSWQMLPDDSHLDQGTIRQAAEGKGFDAVLISRFRGLRDQVSYMPNGHSWGSYIDYWGPMMYTPGYFDVTEVAWMESSLFNMRDDGGEIWTITTRTQIRSTPQKSIPSFVAKVVGELKKDLRLG